MVDRLFIDGFKCSLGAKPDLVDPLFTPGRVVIMKQNPELTAQELSKEVTIDPTIYDAAKYWLASLIQQGNPVPEPLQNGSGGVLTGKVARVRCFRNAPRSGKTQSRRYKRQYVTNSAALRHGPQTGALWRASRHALALGGERPVFLQAA